MPLPVLLPYTISPLNRPGYGAFVGHSLNHGPPIIIAKLDSPPTSQEKFIVRGLPDGSFVIDTTYESFSPTQNIDGKLWANPSLLPTYWNLEVDAKTQSIRIHQTGTNLVWKAPASETTAQILLEASTGGTPEINPLEFWTFALATQEGESLAVTTTNLVSIRQIRPYIAQAYCAAAGKAGSPVDLNRVEEPLSDTQIWYFVQDLIANEVVITSAVTPGASIQTSGDILVVGNSATVEKWKLEPSSVANLFRIKAEGSGKVWISPVPISFNRQIFVGPSIGGSAPTEENATQFWHIINVEPNQLKLSGPPKPTTITDASGSEETTKAPTSTVAQVKSGVYSIQPVAQSNNAATIGGATENGAHVLTYQFEDDYPINQLFNIQQHGSQYVITSLTGAYAQGSGLYVVVNANLKPTYWTFESVNNNFIIKLQGTNKVWTDQKPPLLSGKVLLTDEVQGLVTQQWALKVPLA